MRGKVALLYWASAGALAGFGLIGLMTIGGPFLIAGVLLAVVGLLFWRMSGVWAFIAGFGGLPALVFLLHIIGGIRSRLNPYCSQSMDPGVGVPPGAGPITCSYVPFGYYAMFAAFAALALCGVALGLSRRRAGRRAAAT